MSRACKSCGCKAAKAGKSATPRHGEGSRRKRGLRRAAEPGAEDRPYWSQRLRDDGDWVIVRTHTISPHERIRVIQPIALTRWGAAAVEAQDFAAGAAELEGVHAAAAHQISH